jgi:hypothetical protein
MTCRGLADGRAGSLLWANGAVHPDTLPERASLPPLLILALRGGYLLLLLRTTAQGRATSGEAMSQLQYSMCVVRGEAYPRSARNPMSGNSRETLRENGARVLYSNSTFDGAADHSWCLFSNAMDFSLGFIKSK